MTLIMQAWEQLQETNQHKIRFYRVLPWGELAPQLVYIQFIFLVFFVVQITTANYLTLESFYNSTGHITS